MLHPLYSLKEEVENLFIRFGFKEVEGYEIVDRYENFEFLSFHPFHLSIEERNAFILKNGKLLRTHTSSMQYKMMRSFSPPFKLFSSGRVFRKELSGIHRYVFEQIEGLWMDTTLTFKGLLNFLNVFIKKLIKVEKIVFMPAYYPYAHPGFKIVSFCPVCKGKGCRLCKHTGFLEIMGAGMVSKNILEKADIDSNIWKGFAFGIDLQAISVFKFRLEKIDTFLRNNYFTFKNFKKYVV